MKRFFAIILLLITFSSQGQNDITKHIIGSWEIESVQIKTSNPKEKEFSKEFIGSIFQFNENHNFIFKSEKNSKLMLMFSKMLNNTKWLFDEKKAEFRIGNKEDYFSILIIKVKTENDKTIFFLKETGIVLLMKQPN